MTEDMDADEDCLPKLNEQRWLAHAREHEMHHEAHEKDHKSYNERVELETRILNERLEGMNEFRNQINQERIDFVRRDVLSQHQQTISALMEAQSVRIASLEVSRGNLEGRMWAIGATIGLFVTLLSIGIAVFV